MFVSTKIIKGKEQKYLEKSIRQYDGKVKKYSLYLKSSYKKNESIKALNLILRERSTKYNVNTFEKDRIIDKTQLTKIEYIKFDYRRLVKELTKKQYEDILDRFAVNFTYESNALEGNSLTVKDVAILLHEKQLAKGKSIRELHETINTRKALELIFKSKFKINEEDIIKLHRLVVKDTGVKLGYKKLPNFILGKNVQTTKPENVKKEMNELIKWYESAKTVHPLKKAAIFHGKFEKIHPFEDGNGRVGRLLMNVILMSSGYPPLIIRKSQKIAYLSCLEAFDTGHNDKLIRFILDKYKSTYEKFFKIYIKYLD